jgi:hypothetical protein
MLITLPKATRLSHPLGPVAFRPSVTRGLVFSMVPNALQKEFFSFCDQSRLDFFVNLFGCNEPCLAYGDFKIKKKITLNFFRNSIDPDKHCSHITSKKSTVFRPQ